jgi:hypothetical protein
MQFLDKHGLGIFLAQLKKIFGYKATLDETMNIRKQYLLDVDYEKELAFDTTWIVGDNSPYVGSARVGQTYVA